MAFNPMIGKLYLVSIPLGNMGDMTSRALDTLGSVDFVAVEDKRRSSILFRNFGIHTPMISYHDFSEEKQIKKIIDLLLSGKSVALICDAGTPLISDPGFKLVKLAKSKEIKVSPIPGPCALIAAISASGLPSDRFIFEGFLPSKSAARIEKIKRISKDSRTIIFYEAPHRILGSLRDMLEIIGPTREIVMARELTKTYETFFSGSIESTLQFVEQDLNQQKGEMVLVLAGADPEEKKDDTQDIQRVLSVLLEELPLKQAVSLGAKITGGQKNILYKSALDLKK
ncbi:MAG: 16S rRNA (cytidine(1402)-2'-O)-methyltransferase [Porticoccus sp.]|jgi:16S rRNA (cytidine1402-2'-O)-methyltransferase|nr:16S rRNA (cytidine(1402)-2'-O)-methyltransferase [Porticoccus sp.]